MKITTARNYRELKEILNQNPLPKKIVVCDPKHYLPNIEVIQKAGKVTAVVGALGTLAVAGRFYK
jgi:hypothetical protein